VKRVVALVSAAAVAVTVAGFSGAQAAPAAPSAPAAGAFTPTLTGWSGPPNDVQHATLTVPMDYANPDNGQTVKLAVTRAPATGSVASYQGILVGNPGGPGGSGTGLAGYLKSAIPGGGASNYDVLGFDPRGVGASTPSLHCNTRYFGNNRPSYVPRTKSLMAFWLKKAKGYAAACGRSSAKQLLPHLTTWDTVQDMESLRVAFQNQVAFAKKPKLDTLNFYGFSYGTYLGQVYATRYPTKVGRFVLDGVVDPTTWWYRSNLQQEVGFDRNINIFFKWIAKHNGAFHLGKNWKKIRKGYYALSKKLDRRPAAGKRLGPDELADAMLYAAYFPDLWRDIGSAYSQLVRKGQGSWMLSIYSSFNQGAENENGYAVYLAVQCTDQRRPPWATQVKDAKRIHRNHPFLAWNNTWYNAPCLTWPAPSRAAINVNGSAVTGKILLINETLDAATPYSGALTARGRFPTSRLIAGVGGTTHSGSLSGVRCVDDRIASFLATGALPARQSGRRSDVNCPKVQPPSARSGRPAARDLAGMRLLVP
jgi:pimeloyl-ACP methyl ester carboxylesterase